VTDEQKLSRHADRTALTSTYQERGFGSDIRL
jgi:hypothetical protein